MARSAGGSDQSSPPRPPLHPPNRTTVRGKEVWWGVGRGAESRAALDLDKEYGYRLALKKC